MFAEPGWFDGFGVDLDRDHAVQLVAVEAVDQVAERLAASALGQEVLEVLVPERTDLHLERSRRRAHLGSECTKATECAVFAAEYVLLMRRDLDPTHLAGMHFQRHGERRAQNLFEGRFG